MRSQPMPSTTREILSSTAWALLAIAGALLIVAGLAAWRCTDPTSVLVGVTDGLGWVAISIGVPVTGVGIARKIIDLRAAIGGTTTTTASVQSRTTTPTEP